MSRKLVTVRQIDSLHPIDGADLIEAARIDGWQLVVKKGEFQAGDMCLYFEVDSFLPVKPQYEFLRKSSFKKMFDGTEGFRLKTIKMKGQISQGLALPITTGRDTYEIGDDVTESLGVKLWEPPPPKEGGMNVGLPKGNFPHFIRKTDQERIQNLAKVVDKFANVTFEVTEKLDGTSVTMFYNNGEFGVCSRNFERKEDDASDLWAQAHGLNMREQLTLLGRNLAFQGELIGPKIQGNKYKLKGQSWYIFDIFDIDKQEYVSSTERLGLCRLLQLNHVPIICDNWTQTVTSVEGYLSMAVRDSTLYPTKAEGLVFKAQSDVKCSFKAINNEFLLADK